MASPSASELVSTTLRNRSAKLADNVTNNNAILGRLKKRGSIAPADGGRTIFQPLEYQANGTYTRYAGYEPLNITPQDIITGVDYDWKQVAVSISMSGLEAEVQNVGEAAVIDIVKARVKNAEKAMMNGLSADLYSNGSADSGKQIGGLQQLIADSPSVGVVAGLDRSQWPFWRNQSYSIYGNTGSAASAANIQAAMQQLYMSCTRGTDVPDLWIADNNFYGYFWSALQNIQRITESREAVAGYRSLKFVDSDVVLDGGIGGACPPNHMYAINSDYLKYRPSTSRNMVLRGKVNSINQDASVDLLVWAGNLTLSNAEVQGVLTA